MKTEDSLKSHVADEFQAFCQDLKQITNIDSGTGNVEGSVRIANFLKERINFWGGMVEFRSSDQGTHVIDSVNLDAPVTNDRESNIVIKQVLEGLCDYGSDFKVIPVLATNWEASDDGKPSLFNALLVIAIINIPSYGRLVRSKVLIIKQEEYVTFSIDNIFIIM